MWNQICRVFWKFNVRVIDSQTIGFKSSLHPFPDLLITKLTHDRKQGFTFPVLAKNGNSRFIGRIDIHRELVETATVIITDFQPDGERP